MNAADCTPEQRAVMAQATIAALAEVGYKAWAEDNNTIIRTIRQPPCDLAYRASTLGDMAVGFGDNVDTFDEWHARQTAAGYCTCKRQR